MFTGLIESVGKIKSVRTRGNYRVFTLLSDIPTDDISIGESIACDGACLTVVSKDRSGFTVEASQESLALTTLGSVKTGSSVNLERALQVGGRLGGHLVTGHVDTIGRVDSVRTIGESTVWRIRYDNRFDNLVVSKGSITINGVSLTVNEAERGWLTVNIIPHTIKSTNLSGLKPSSSVNLEFDIIGKYIARNIDKENNSGLTIKKLIESGF